MNTARTLLLSSALWGCSDAGVKAINAEPEAEITSHGNGAEVLEGYTVSFRGTVSDPDHSASELTATWLSDAEVLCESAAPDDDGISTCEALIPSTLTTLILEVQDPGNAGGSDQIQLSVVATESPEAQITAPSEDGVFYSDQLITFEGLLSDGEDPSTELVAGWESSLDGALDVEATPDADGRSRALDT